MDLSREHRKVEWLELRTLFLLVPCVLGTALATGLFTLTFSVPVNWIVETWGGGYGTPWTPPKGMMLGCTLVGLALIGLGVIVKRAELKDGPRRVVAELGGKLVTEGASTDLLEKRLANVVGELAVAMGTAVPNIYLLEHEPGINAFALGKEIEDSIIVVTQGALEHLSRAELQAVVAHEFYHILNGDSKFNMWLLAWIFGVLTIFILGRELLARSCCLPQRWLPHTGGIGEVFLRPVFLILGIGFFLVGSVGAFLARLLQRDLIHHHEFRADLGALHLTREPSALRSAFRTIERHGSRVYSHHASEVGHCFFAEWGSDAFPVNTHPSFAQRRAKISQARFNRKGGPKVERTDQSDR